jgi:hypothetical protein
MRRELFNYAEKLLRIDVKKDFLRFNEFDKKMDSAIQRSVSNLLDDNKRNNEEGNRFNLKTEQEIVEYFRLTNVFNDVMVDNKKKQK